MATTPGINIDRALSGSDRNVSENVDKFTRDHRFNFGDLKGLAKSTGDVAAYGQQISRLEDLRTTVMRDAKISPIEREALGTRMNAVEKAGVKAFKDQEGSSDTVSKSVEAVAEPAKTTAKSNAVAEPKAVAKEPAKAGSKPVDEAAAPSADRYRDAPGIEAVQKGDKVLTRGESGPAVTEAQTLLKGIKDDNGQPKYDLGEFGTEKDGVDGKLGPKTTEAVEKFKADHGIKADGQGTVDKDTLARLRAESTASVDQAAPAKTEAASSAQECKPGTSEAADKSANTEGGPLKFDAQTGKLTVEGTTADEDVVMRKNGRNYEVDYARRDGEKVVERRSLQISSDQLKEAKIVGGGGTDRIWNGDGKQAGIDGASISTSGEHALITNHADDVNIDLRGRGFVDNFGDRAQIKGSTGGDWIKNGGDNAQIMGGAFGRIDNVGDDARIRLEGGNVLSSVGDGAIVEAENSAADQIGIIGERNTVRYDDLHDNGALATPEGASWHGVSVDDERARLSPENTPIPGDLSPTQPETERQR